MRPKQFVSSNKTWSLSFSSIKKVKFNICWLIPAAFFYRQILRSYDFYFQRIEIVTIAILQKWFICNNTYWKIVDSQCSDDVGLEKELGGVAGSKKGTVVKKELIFYFAVLSSYEVEVELAIGDIFAKILNNCYFTSSTRMRSHYFSKT